MDVEAFLMKRNQKRKQKPAAENDNEKNTFHAMAMKKESPQKRKRKRKSKLAISVDDEDNLSVGADDSFRDSKGCEMLFTQKRMRAAAVRAGFTKVRPDMFHIIDAHLKQSLREVVQRGILTAACQRRKHPTQKDAITAIQEMSYFPSVILGWFFSYGAKDEQKYSKKQNELTLKDYRSWEKR